MEHVGQVLPWNAHAGVPRSDVESGTVALDGNRYVVRLGAIRRIAQQIRENAARSVPVRTQRGFRRYLR